MARPHHSSHQSHYSVQTKCHLSNILLLVENRAMSRPAKARSVL